MYVPLCVQTKEELYQALGYLASQVSGFYQATALQPAWAAALVGDLPSMTNGNIRIMQRHVTIPLCKACPPVHRSATAESSSRKPYLNYPKP